MFGLVEFKLFDRRTNTLSCSHD